MHYVPAAVQLHKESAGVVYGRHLAYFPCMTKHIITSTITAVALATVCACNKDNRDNTNAMPPANQTPITQSAPPADQQAVNSPITVTGCLQKKGGLTTTFIVTGINEPSQKGIGTTGNGTAVEREQLREAENSYRVSPKDNVDMDSMVGKQVRVSGVIAKRADLPEPATATSGKKEAKEMEKISKGDLAKIDDATISVVSDNCGGHEAQSSSKTKAKGEKKRKG
jgi:hypothetical protein